MLLPDKSIAFNTSCGKCLAAIREASFADASDSVEGAVYAPACSRGVWAGHSVHLRLFLCLFLCLPSRVWVQAQFDSSACNMNTAGHNKHTTCSPMTKLSNKYPMPTDRLHPRTMTRHGHTPKCAGQPIRDACISSKQIRDSHVPRKTWSPLKKMIDAPSTTMKTKQPSILCALFDLCMRSSASDCGLQMKNLSANDKKTHFHCRYCMVYTDFGGDAGGLNDHHPGESVDPVEFLSGEREERKRAPSSMRAFIRGCGPTKSYKCLCTLL